MLVKLKVNGRKVEGDVAPDMRLFDFLRSQGLKSVKCGCETTNCGLCTVWLDGVPVLSCAVPMGRADGREVTTLEALRLESAEFATCMAEEGAEQCGFCSPGLVMNVMALRREHPDADDELIRRYLSGNLCRCSGYASQMRAVRRFLGVGAAGACAPVSGGREGEAGADVAVRPSAPSGAGAAGRQREAVLA